MPTYGYRCTVCSHEFERVQKMSDPRITECEECNGLVKKIIYPVGIAFKGDGFYINDSKPAEAKTETVATETKTETVKTEATPAPAETKAKTETKPTAS
jgi:putative FmdB family regulatory protein